jgi:hypothetical protein
MTFQLLHLCDIHLHMHVSFTLIIKKEIIGQGLNNMHFEAISPNYRTTGVIPMFLCRDMFCKTDVVSSHVSNICV